MRAIRRLLGRRRAALSETACSLLWLLENDPGGWIADHYSVVHVGSGVGVWIANGFGALSAYYGIAEDDARRVYILGGREVKLSQYDRWVLFKAFNAYHSLRNGKQVPRAISEWAMTRSDGGVVEVSNGTE